jgi:two-component system, chemotaxis family, sensor kinase CheA
MTIVYLKELLNSEPRALSLGDKTKLPEGEQNVIIVTYNNRRLGLVVDRLVRQQDIVVKPLNKPLDTIDLYGGVTLLGTGKVCFVLDVPAIVKYVINRH